MAANTPSTHGPARRQLATETPSGGQSSAQTRELVDRVRATAAPSASSAGAGLRAGLLQLLKVRARSREERRF